MSGRDIPLNKIRENVWEIPKNYKEGMRVPGRVYASEELLQKIRSDRTLWQCTNVAYLPGIQKYAITLPDGHEGYGFPIGGVAATDREEGVISPGGVGYDINCGVRLLTTNFSDKDIQPKLKDIGEALFKNIPSGLGSSRKKFRLDKRELDELVTEGSPWLIEREMGWPEDAEHCEEEGHMAEANPDKLSERANDRGLAQVGTLGSGNHFLEIQKVDKIFDEKTAKAFGIDHEDQVTVMIHTGSRGFGHQVCSDYLKVMDRALNKYNISLPDRELACTPGNSKEGEDYFQAMSCAVNYAFSNRQAITHWTRESFQEVFNKSPEEMGLELIYDVAHNIVKKEEHEIDGRNRKVWTHRKGATRAFGPGSSEIPARYRNLGQPVFIPGTMGTSSYLLVGREPAMNLSFGSTPHGAGRLMSRSAAKREFWGGDVKKRLESRGMVVRSASQVILAEEASGAYKDVNTVVDVSQSLGLGSRVARMLPLAVVKG
jgi:tRNA-splicing ligase RtcB